MTDDERRRSLIFRPIARIEIAAASRKQMPKQKAQKMISHISALFACYTMPQTLYIHQWLVRRQDAALGSGIAIGSEQRWQAGARQDEHHADDLRPLQTLAQQCDR